MSGKSIKERTASIILNDRNDDRIELMRRLQKTNLSGFSSVSKILRQFDQWSRATDRYDDLKVRISQKK